MFWHADATPSTSGPPCDALRLVLEDVTRCATGSAKQAESPLATACAACGRAATATAGAASVPPVLVAVAMATGVGLSTVASASLPVAGSVTTLTISSTWSAVLPTPAAVAAVMAVENGS